MGDERLHLDRSLRARARRARRNVANAFGLHPLAVEDAVAAHQRPKLERLRGQPVPLLKTLWYVDEDDAVETGEINIFVGDDFVITVRHGRGLRAAHARLDARGAAERAQPRAVRGGLRRLRQRRRRLPRRRADELQIDVDEVEASVFSTARTNDSARIYTLKRELAEVRRAVLPLREPMRALHRRRGPRRSSPEPRPLLPRRRRPPRAGRRGHRHPRPLLSTAFEAHLARIQVQQNEDMRKISAGRRAGRRTRP